MVKLCSHVPFLSLPATGHGILLFAQPWGDVFRGSALVGKLPLLCHPVGTVQLLEEREERLLQWGGDSF